jgi:hypothetical protein
VHRRRFLLAAILALSAAAVTFAQARTVWSGVYPAGDADLPPDAAILRTTAIVREPQ